MAIAAKRQQRWFIVIFLSPAILLFTVFIMAPALRAFSYSLQRWDGLSAPVWVGLSNYADLFRDGDIFIRALAHNLAITLVAGSITLSFSLFLAAALHRRVRGTTLFRITFFFPNVLASVAVALVWLMLYSTTEFGVFNGALRYVQETTGWQLVKLPVAFTGKKFLIAAIIPMLVWTFTGFYMVLFLAAMEGIPETYYEAARLDGASEWRQFFSITLPMIREVLAVGAVFLVITCFKIFEPVWIMDNEWPTKETHVLATLLYQKAFSEYNIGYGSAVAVVMFFVVFAATLVTLRISRKEALQY